MKLYDKEFDQRVIKGIRRHSGKILVGAALIGAGLEAGCTSTPTPTPTERPVAAAAPTENFLATLVAQNTEFLRLLNRTPEAQVNPTLAPATARVTATKPAEPTKALVENKPARLLSLAELKTAQQVFDAVFVPVDPNFPHARNLTVGEIQPDFNKDGKQVGWRISRAKNQLGGDPTYLPAFRVNLPRQFGMQWGFLAIPSERESMGLTVSEALSIGLNADAKLAGVPCDMDLYVEGLAISDQKDFYAKLPQQTGFDRLNRKR